MLIGTCVLGFALTMVVVDKLIEDKVDKKMYESIRDNDKTTHEPIKWSHEYDWVERHNR